MVYGKQKLRIFFVLYITRFAREREANSKDEAARKPRKSELRANYLFVSNQKEVTPMALARELLAA
jgi:hypothetical protein